MTAKVSPSVGRAWRSACSAIAPSVAKAASSSVTPAGTFAHRWCGTRFSSAWLASPAPAQATRSPTPKPLTPAPTASTRPAQA